MTIASTSIRLAVLLFLAAAVLLQWTGKQQQTPLAAVQQRHLADETATVLALGTSNFTITVDGTTTPSPSIRVVHGSTTTTQLMEIRSIQAAKGSSQVKETRGLFQVSDAVWARTSEFTVDDVLVGDASSEGDDATAASVTVRGELFETFSIFFWNLWSTPVLQYSMVFSTIPASTSTSQQQIAFAIRLAALDGSQQDQYNRVFLTHDSTSDEKFFGFGEQFTHLDMKGKDPTIVTSEMESDAEQV